RDEHLLVGHLGPDLLAAGVDLEECARRVRAQGDRPIGAVLLDQTAVAGVGTLYLAAPLWAHRVHPLRPARHAIEPAGATAPALLAAGVDLEECARRVRAQGDRPIGAVLLDQTVVAGIGTLYLAESLWAHRVHPLRPARDVTEPVCATARALMLRSADAPLPTATGETAPGRTSHVHGRRGRPCRRCGTPIAELAVGPPGQERPAFFCPACQPA